MSLTDEHFHTKFRISQKYQDPQTHQVNDWIQVCVKGDKKHLIA